MLDKVFFAVLLPGLGAGVIVLLAWMPWRSRRPRAGGPWSGAVAIAGSFLASFVIVAGRPTWPLEARWHALVPIVVIAALVAAGTGLLVRGRGRTWLGPLLAGIATMLLLDPPPSVAWPWMWRLAIGALVAGLGAGLEPIAARREGASVPLALCAWLAASSMLITEAGIASLGLMVAAGSAAAGMIVAIAWWKPSVSAAGGATGAATALGAVALAIGWLWTREYTMVPGASFALLALAPLALWAAEIRAVTTRAGWIAAAARLAAVAIPAAIALLLAISVAESDSLGY